MLSRYSWAGARNPGEHGGAVSIARGISVVEMDAFRQNQFLHNRLLTDYMDLCDSVEIIRRIYDHRYKTRKPYMIRVRDED